MLQLLPSLRLAWIPGHELKGVLELPMIQQLVQVDGHSQLSKQVDEAIGHQLLHKRKRET
jgi:hypothetical protein